MTVLSGVDMAEATRLTRLGRLDDAMAVLRGRTAGSVPRVPRASVRDASVLRLQPQLRPGAAPTQSLHGRGYQGLAGAGWAERAGLDSRPMADPTLDPGGLIRSKGRAPAGPIAVGASFEEATFTSPFGNRTYKLYVPSGYHAQAVPLIVMLHGCTQSPDDFAAGTKMNALAEEHTFLVAYPAQPPSANPSRCWNWFKAGDQRRGLGEPAILAGLTRRIMNEFRVDEGRVYIAGLSAGGAAAAIMGSAYPDLYAAIGVHSGLACGAAKDMPSALLAMSQGGHAPARPSHARLVPTIVFHGDTDRTVSATNGDQVIAQVRAGARLRVVATRGKSAGGATYQKIVHIDENDTPVVEQWIVHGAGHAWSGGSATGTFTDPVGPDASREMVRFFLQHHAGRSRADTDAG